VEGLKPDSLKDCWRWIKGLLHDFIAAKESINEKHKYRSGMQMKKVQTTTVDSNPSSTFHTSLN
jgi:hypothetical protein